MARVLPPAGTPYYFSDITCAIAALFDPGAIKLFEEEIRQLTQSKHCLAVNSGRTALTLALSALAKNDSRNEIIIPGYTCFTVPSAIRRAGLKARVVDFAPGTMQYDLNALNTLDTTRTLAMILIYPFAMYSNPEPYVEWAKERNIRVIEDVAQGMGLRHNGRMLGTLAEIGIYSFSKGKTITSVRGGAIVSNQDDIFSIIRERYSASLAPASVVVSLRIIMEAIVLWLFLPPARFGMITKLPFVRLGETVYDPDFSLNQMSRPAARLGIRKLKELESINTDRRGKGLSLIRLLSTMIEKKLIAKTRESEARESLFLRLPLLARTQAVRDALLTHGKQLGFSRMYGEPLSVIDDHELWSGGKTDHTPVAEDFARRLVTLPTHAFVTDDDISKMVTLIQP